MENEKITSETKEEIKKAIEELVLKMGFSCEVEIIEAQNNEQEELVFNIKTEESSYLIGQYGVNLQALQHMARIIFRGKTENKANFTLDVNSYRQEKNESVFALAKNMAETSLREGRAVVMRPMSPYERRLVHMELAKNDQIKTESTGEGEDRRVVIKPANLV
ncbi:MAG: Single-stranded nucleic acid binding R3H domain-containing protein [Candidatus Moranbacteria bacterium GW2011_GWF2_36_839]|nr:MAG: Single-stranded nucleic acid binding R3H domain-containing protein [Candidatus Moranbacteria bacterium GW2011_GWF1_36_78]KKQ17231.1 MAG: Single-stranded nucleic acid binding R3H domain-containing protein [Candidatus Moranbacteria bacterium GW2011_GWF2_36_839]HAT73749.1 hypothetical protein [Candidatus Moranbacteria bacterium]HBY11262.1 hypothetical protein [Candidatus Moranbacteria bacterium]